MTAASRLYARSRPRSSDDERFLRANFGADRGAAYDYALTYDDAACVRASVAWLHDKHTGTLTEYAANTARILGNGAIFVEGASTNICLRSRSLVTAPWGAPFDADSVEATTEPGPDGTACGGLVTLFGRGAPAYVTQDVSAALSSSTRYTLTAFMKRLGAVPCDVFAYWENKAGSATIPDTAFVPTAVWRRTQPNSQGSATGGGGDIFLSGSGDDSTSRFFVDFVQLEALDFASSPIVTAGASATRSADAVTVSAGDWNTDIGSAPWAFWFEPSFGSYNERNAGNACVLFSCNSGNDRVELTATNTISVWDGGVLRVSSNPLTFDPGLRIHVAVDPAGPSVTVSGAFDGNGKRTGATPYTWTTSGALSISQTSPGPFFGSISRPRMI